MPQVRYCIRLNSLHRRALQKKAASVFAHENGWKKFGFDFIHVEPGPAVDVSLGITPATSMNTLFPSFKQQRLSVCLLETGIIHFHEERWLRGSNASGYTDLEDYRTYVINHEVGHALGAGHLEACVPDGSTPVMMQQTLTTNGCKPRPYPSAQDFWLTRWGQVVKKVGGSEKSENQDSR